MPPLVRPALGPGSLARRRQPLLGGDGLVLRPWRARDVRTVCAAYADPEIQQWHARSLTFAEAQDWIASRDRLWAREIGADWAVIAASQVVGRVALRRLLLAEGLGEVAYWVLSSARGAGIASAAVRVLSAWSFGDLGLHRIELMHSTRNPASCRVAVRAGYALEGTKRQETLHPDGWHDMHMHARLAGDPPVAEDRGARDFARPARR